MTGVTDNEVQNSALWQHLKKTLFQVVQQHPQSALDAIIPASFATQTGHTIPPHVRTIYADHRPKVVNTIPRDRTRELALGVKFWGRTGTTEAETQTLGEEDEEEEIEDKSEEEDEVLLGEISDVVAEQAVFNSVGEGLQPEEAFRLVVGMKQLLKSEPLASVRFWGKIFGYRADYYIVETKLDPERVPDEEEEDIVDEEEDGVPVDNIANVLYAHGEKRRADTAAEPSGSGLNEWVYYVSLTTDPTKWTKLPDVSPSQIMVARLIRRRFTGDLESSVDTHPCFPGKEIGYLRAQIARISCTCRVAPREMYTTEGAVPEEEDEDGSILPPPLTVPAYTVLPPLIPQEVPDDEDSEAIEPVKAWFYGYRDDELLQGKNWVHIAPTLLRNGRTVISEVEEQYSDAKEGGAEFDHTEKISPFLSDLTRDNPLTYTCHSRGNLPAWGFRKAFHDESSKTRTYVARSGLWPGAFTYAVTVLGSPGCEYQSIYIGTGLKNLQDMNYAPKLPPRCLVEYPEVNLVLQRDGTVDDELEYAPPPPKPEFNGSEEDEDEV